jgi:hypothetical protein
MVTPQPPLLLAIDHSVIYANPYHIFNMMSQWVIGVDYICADDGE